MIKWFESLFCETQGFKKIKRGKVFKKGERKPIFSSKGHITYKSISDRREAFLGKSAPKIASILEKHGYKTQIKDSKHVGSKAKIITTLNPSKERNITQTQVTKKGRRHGNIAYVKISTSDIGRIKIIDAKIENYIIGKDEKAKLLFRRDINEDE